MKRSFKIGDFVVSDDIEGKVIEVLDLAGDIYLKVKSPEGNLIVPCEEAKHRDDVA